MNQLVFLCFLIVLPAVFTQPNFVIFLADDLGYGDLGCFGNTSINTPNIDKLAESGLKLKHHLSADAVCTPSRAAFLTGRYPVRSGMASSSRNKVFLFVAASGGLPENEITFARSLKEKNYSTAIIGKWHLGNDRLTKGDGCHHPLNHGFDYFYGLPLTNFKDLGSNGESVITAYIPYFYTYVTTMIVLGVSLSYLAFYKHKILGLLILTLLVIPIFFCFFLFNLKTINGVLLENKDVIEQPVRLKGLTQRFVWKAKQFLNEQTNLKKPFLLYMPFVHVHTALFCSNDFEGKSAHGRYGDNIQEMDWAVGEIMNTLKKLDILHDTFVYFSSDNGGHIEEVGHDGQREGGFNGVLKGGKMMGGMEGGIRVPSIISWPSKIPPREVDVMTSQMDILPTMLEIVGTPVAKDRQIDGKSLVPIFEDSTKNLHKILFHYCGMFIHAATYIPVKGEKWKIHWSTPKFIPGTDRCPYVCHCFGEFIVHHNPPLLYDLAHDISESNSIDVASDKKYLEIISIVNNAKRETSDMGTIKWQYLQDLHEVQNEIGLKFANKISGAHINFKNKKMNVSLAAQTLSSGAADALQFLLETKNAKFLGAEGTINFIRIIDRIFDLCNSRSPYGKGFKSPLALRNCSWWENIFEETLGYLANLKLDNIPILQSPRKTFALGFIVTIKSISLIAKEILSRESNPFKYFLTYKVSQDHIELFFNNIRACGGFNNNPNACQFRWAMRKMLLSRNVSSKNSNCLSNDYEMPSSILEFRSEKRTKVDGISEDDCFLLSAYSDFLDSECLSNYQKNILCYMGGYIVKNLVKKCTCIECIKMLTYENNFHDYCKPTVENPHCFVNVVSRGGLKLCSPTVFNIVCAAEKAFKFLVVKEKHNANVNREILFVTNEYLDSQGIKFFHPIENELGWEDLHETQMTKKIIESFVKIRIRSYEKVLTNEINKNSATVRQKLTKLILFNNV